jgi:hypothetical protein
MPRGCPVASLEDRFLRKTTMIGECRVWTGNKYLNGYGQLVPKVWGTTYAHQWACHHWNKSPLPVEPEMCIKHSCDNRLCVNPAHLSYGTLAENREEMYERNPNALGRIVPTEDELTRLRELVDANTARREIARQLNHSRHWVDRIRRDYGI